MAEVNISPPPLPPADGSGQVGGETAVPEVSGEDAVSKQTLDQRMALLGQIFAPIKRFQPMVFYPWEENKPWGFWVAIPEGRSAGVVNFTPNDTLSGRMLPCPPSLCMVDIEKKPIPTFIVFPSVFASDFLKNSELFEVLGRNAQILLELDRAEGMKERLETSVQTVKTLTTQNRLLMNENAELSESRIELPTIPRDWMGKFFSLIKNAGGYDFQSPPPSYSERSLSQQVKNRLLPLTMGLLLAYLVLKDVVIPFLGGL